LAITNDGHVAIATNSQTLIWRNTQNSQESHVSTDQKAWSIAVLPGSSTPTVAVGTIGAVRFWNPPAASLRDGFHDQDKPMTPVDFVACSSYGSIIASSSVEGNAYQWNLNNTAQILRLNTPEQMVRSLAMDSAGNRIAILTTEGVIAIFAAGQTRPEMILQVQALDISQIAMNADGSVLAAASSQGVRIYELKDKALAAVARVYLKDALVNNQSCMGVSLNRSNCERDLTEINKEDQGISK
jgi:WD40 repeat protein